MKRFHKQSWGGLVRQLRLGIPFMAAVLAVVSAFASPIEEGVSAYAAGDYPLAARSFETALAASGPSFGVYYNLGMALKREGDAGRAALNILRSLALDPRNTDARMALSDLERSKGIPMKKPAWNDWLAENLPITPLLVAGFAAFWAGAFLLLATFWFRTGTGSRVLSILLAAGGAGLFAAGYLADPRFAWRGEAVVVDPDGVHVLSAPAERSDSVAKLPAASRVHVTTQSGEWSFVRMADGRKGWLNSSGIEGILPRG